MAHPITELLAKQAAFEAKLPNGQLFTGNTESVRTQYQAAMGLLATDSLSDLTEPLPRALIAIMGASLRLDFDLAAGLTNEIPETKRVRTFASLARTAARKIWHRPRGLDGIREYGANYLSNASHYATGMSTAFNNPALSLLANDGIIKLKRQDRVTNLGVALTFSLQDLLAFIGMMDRHPNRDFSAAYILASIDRIHDNIVQRMPK